MVSGTTYSEPGLHQIWAQASVCVSELECVERTELKQTVEELEAELKAREEELETLREEVEKASQLQTQRDSLTQKLQETELKGAELLDLEQRLERESFRRSLRSLLDTLNPKILQLTELRDTQTLTHTHTHTHTPSYETL
uniref:Uncharacterized protein n=1 Tax=Cyprinus carpio TaxID=7962 RepID=A0A8C2D589_CYPCA